MDHRKGKKKQLSHTILPNRPEFQWCSIPQDNGIRVSKTSDPDFLYKCTNGAECSLSSELNKAKAKLGKYHRSDIFHSRGKCNPLELLGSHIFVSRAALKAAEMNWMFDLLESAASLAGESASLRVADVGAGPGGFSEFLLWKTRHEQGLREGKRKPKTTQNLRYVNDLSVIGVTLRGSQDFRVDDFHIDAPTNTFRAIYGPHNTGDITDASVINEVHDVVKSEGKFHLYMADGGVDFTGRESEQEVVIIPLLSAQLALGLETLIEGGCLVCKLYTTYLDITVSLVHIVGSCFEKFTLVKPLTSRPANSEVYLVCIGYKGGGDSATTVREIAGITKDSKCETDTTTLSTSFIHWLRKHNHTHAANQLKSLNMLFKCMDGTANHPDSLQDDVYKQYLRMWGVATKIPKRKRSRASWIPATTSDEPKAVATHPQDPAGIGT